MGKAMEAQVDKCLHLGWGWGWGWWPSTLVFPMGGEMVLELGVVVAQPWEYMENHRTVCSGMVTFIVGRLKNRPLKKVPRGAHTPSCCRLASLPGRGEQDSAERSVRRCGAVAWDLQ